MNIFRHIKRNVTLEVKMKINVFLKFTLKRFNNILPISKKKKKKNNSPITILRRIPSIVHQPNDLISNKGKGRDRAHSENHRTMIISFSCLFFSVGPTNE